MKSIAEYAPSKIDRPWGYELIVIETKDYLGKLLFYQKGCAGGLQYHRRKDEAFHLLNGLARVDCDDGTGQLVRHAMFPGQTFHIPPGAPHRVYAIEDCLFMEVSTPIHDDRVRCEAEYGEDVIGDQGEGLPSV